MQNTKIFAGNAVKRMAQAIGTSLGMELGRATVAQFSDGEVRVEIDESVAGANVFIIQSTCAPSAHNIMELRLLADACRRSDAASITAVIPYFGYARQDRVPRSKRTPISAALMMRDLNTAGVSRLVTMELHAAQIAASFAGPVRHLYASHLLGAALTDTYELHNPVVVAPDAGGVVLAVKYAERLNAGFGVVNKYRSGPNVSEVKGFTGEVEDCDVILVDDMIDTAGTITAAAKYVMDLGARRVFVLATHAVLSGPAIERITASCIEAMFVTDTIPLSEAAWGCDKIRVVSVVPLFVEAMRRLHTNGSINDLDG
ncbi:MAG: phosphoribosylpyrophosphate synthetase [Candidatus Pacebacteria bacterium CG10_big_fil_rev_8_21_14_0_10_45_6]|nr:MAG: phosphoribosylpyrophosphate synthetase [Candidatus Pacebacteria bacterium CG10_big_fil_rev_8_21_14_0_10_45_6]